MNYLGANLSIEHLNITQIIPGQKNDSVRKDGDRRSSYQNKIINLLCG
jgi:hypothetical protein